MCLKGNLRDVWDGREKMTKKVQNQKKDFVKTTHKVGKSKTKLNETKADSVSSKRVVMPSQNLESTGDVIGEALVGLRHYNEKKRLDAMFSLIRAGHREIPISYIGDVLLGVGFCLCDEDAMVRSKCASYLVQVLNVTNKTFVDPFLPKIAILVRAGLGNVSASIRGDSISFLHRLIVSNPLFTADDTKEFIVTLIQIDATFITEGKKSSFGSRTSLWDSIELLLGHLCQLQEAVRIGVTFDSEWTVLNILSRVFSPQDKVGPSLRKLFTTLTRLGEDDRAARLSDLAQNIGFSVNEITDRPINVTKKKQNSSSGKNSVFSRYSALMVNDDSD
jgi:hypothetical protein